MFDCKKLFLIISVVSYMFASSAQEYVPKLVIQNMTRSVLTMSNAGGYLDLELRGGGWVHDKAFISGDLVCQPGATLIFEVLPTKLQCSDTYFLSPAVYQKWIAGKIRLWGGYRIFLSEPDVRPILSAEIVQKAIESQKDIQVSIKREKWIKSVYKLRKPSRHYRISYVGLVDRDDMSSWVENLK